MVLGSDERSYEECSYKHEHSNDVLTRINLIIDGLLSVYLCLKSRMCHEVC